MLTRRQTLAGLGAMPLAGVATGATAMTPFVVPAEEAPHELTFMQWPVSRAVYEDAAFLRHVQRTIADVANAIAEFEPVVLLSDADHHAAIKRLVRDDVTLWDIPTEDLWCRDSGPIVAVNERGERAVKHIRFNGWGNRQVHRHDGRVAERAGAALGLPVRDTGLRGEAGGVEQDGYGLLMAHESSWVPTTETPA